MHPAIRRSPKYVGTRGCSYDDLDYSRNPVTAETYLSVYLFVSFSSFIIPCEQCVLLFTLHWLILSRLSSMLRINLLCLYPFQALHWMIITVVCNCFFLETGPATTHHCGVILRAVWKERKWVTAVSFTGDGRVLKVRRGDFPQKAYRSNPRPLF